MAETKWTPGPWRMEETETWPFGVSIWGASKLVLVQDRVALSTNQKTLADCLNAVGFEHNPKNPEFSRRAALASLEEQAANLCLFLAAPDIYAEFAHLVRLLEPMESAGTLNVPGLATLNGARAVLARARGEA